MATIGDKKVSLALQDGSSINLNKPKVLPASITKIADIKEPGWYIGGTAKRSDGGHAPASLEDESTPVTLSEDDDVTSQTITSDEKFDDSEINYVITDAPSSKYNEVFNLYVYPVYLTPDTTGTSYVTGYQYIVIINSKIYVGMQYVAVSDSQNHQVNLEWTMIPSTDDVITEISDSYITGNSYTALSTKGGYNLYSKVSEKLQVYEITANNDLNGFINYNGIFYAETGNTCANKPTNVDAFSIHIEFASNNSTGAKYVTQVLFSLNNTTTAGKIFTRHYDGISKTFTSWKELGAADVVDNLTSTDTDKALSANQGKVLKDIVDGLNNEYGTKIKIGDDFNKIWKKGFYYTEAHTKGEILHAPETVIPSFNDGWNSGMLFYVQPVIINDAYDDAGDGNATKMLVIAHQYLLSYERANTSEHLLQYDAYASRHIRVIVNIADGSVSEYQGCNSEQDWRVMVADNLTTNDSSTALSAAQGKVLNEKVESKMNAPIYSSTKLTPGVSDLADGQIYIVYYN